MKMRKITWIPRNQLIVQSIRTDETSFLEEKQFGSNTLGCLS